MSPAASGARSTLLLQAAVTLLFGLLRPAPSGAWTVATVAVAVAGVGLASAMKPLPALRTAVLGFEGVALAFGALGLVAGHYVPGTIIGISLLIRLAQTSAGDFAAVPQLHPLVPPVDPAVPPGGPAPAAASWAVPPAGAVAPWAVPSAPGVPSVAVPAPYAPSPAGTHPGGRTVLPQPPVQAAEPPPVAPAQVAAPATAPPALAAAPYEPPASQSPLEQAARELAAAPEQAAPPAPEPAPPAAPEAPRSAPACMTILPA